MAARHMPPANGHWLGRRIGCSRDKAQQRTRPFAPSLHRPAPDSCLAYRQCIGSRAKAIGGPAEAQPRPSLGPFLDLGWAFTPGWYPFSQFPFNRRPQPAGLHTATQPGIGVLSPSIVHHKRSLARCVLQSAVGTNRFVEAPGTSSGCSHAQVPAGGAGRRRWNAQTMAVRDPGAPEARRACREGSAAGAVRTCTCTCWPRPWSAQSPP